MRSCIDELVALELVLLVLVLDLLEVVSALDAEVLEVAPVLLAVLLTVDAESPSSESSSAASELFVDDAPLLLSPVSWGASNTNAIIPAATTITMAAIIATIVDALTFFGGCWPGCCWGTYAGITGETAGPRSSCQLAFAWLLDACVGAPQWVQNCLSSETYAPHFVQNIEPSFHTWSEPSSSK